MHRALTAEIRELEAQLDPTRRIRREASGVRCQQLCTGLHQIIKMLPANDGAIESTAGTASATALLKATEEDETSPPVSGSPPQGTSKGSGKSPGEGMAAAVTPLGRAAAEALSLLDALDAQERSVLTDALRGAQRAQQLYQKKVSECKRLRAALRQHQQQPSGTISTNGFKFGDRVVFVRRASPTQAGSTITNLPAPAYAALQEGRGTADRKPYFLSRASESSLLSRSGLLSKAASSSAASSGLLPKVALGCIVHVEHLVANDGEATDLALAPGAEYGVITAEMCDSLGPEVL